MSYSLRRQAFVIDREELTELAEACDVDETTVKLWFEDPEMFRELKVTGEYGLKAFIKGFMIGRQSMLGKGRRDALSALPPPLHAHEFPMSIRKLAKILGISHQTLSRISRRLCLTDQRGSFDSRVLLERADAEQIWALVRDGPPYFKRGALRDER